VLCSPTGTGFTAVDNTVATPIAGTFANLPGPLNVYFRQQRLPSQLPGWERLTLTVVP
jgi:hypothetical protein